MRYKFPKGNKIGLRFKKGYIPWNKGMKGYINAGSFTTEKTSGENNPFYGKKHTLEAKKKMSEVQIGKIGEESKRWKGGRYKMNRKLLKSFGGNMTKGKWSLLKAKYGFMCLCCKRCEPEIQLTIDHIIPVTMWESYIQFHPEIKFKCNDVENVQPLCIRCNQSKFIKVIDYRITQYV